MSRGLPEAEGKALLRQLDPYAALRADLHQVAQERGDWAGIPIPMNEADGLPLVIEPSYPMAEMLMQIGRKKPKADEPAGDFEIVNSFWSRTWRCEIVMFKDRDGRVRHVKIPNCHAGEKILNVLNAEVAWGIEQEAAAVQTLGTLLRHHNFKQYLMTGSFLERSPRSNLMYIFRKLRPTLVMHEKGEEMRWLCALCLHPIGYYDNSWAGAMCPTDDVIAHLMLMRGDEHMYWKRANQIRMHRPEAGL